MSGLSQAEAKLHGLLKEYKSKSKSEDDVELAKLALDMIKLIVGDVYPQNWELEIDRAHEDNSAFYEEILKSHLWGVLVKDMTGSTPDQQLVKWKEKENLEALFNAMNSIFAFSFTLQQETYLLFGNAFQNMLSQYKVA